MVNGAVILPLLRGRRETTEEQTDVPPMTLIPPPESTPIPTPTPPFTPIPKLPPGGGGQIPDAPPQTFGTPEDILQSIPTDEPQFTPIPPRRPGTGTISEQVLAEPSPLPAIFPTEEAIAISRRQRLKIEAERRGRPFTRLETQRFLGGGLGVRALRRGTARAERIGRITGLSFTEVITAALPPRTLEPRVERQLDLRTLELRPSDFGDTSLQTRIPTPTTPPSFVATTTEFLFGETGRPFVGLNLGPRLLPSIQPRDVTATDIQRTFRAAPGAVGFPVRVAGELIPTTPGEVGITGALIGASVLAAPIVGAGIGAGVSVLGFRTAIDPTLTAEQRTAGGLVGVLGGVGVVAGATPFIRGAFARPARIAPEGFQVVPGVRGVGDIGLIQPSGQALRGVELPPRSPLRLGGFRRRLGGEPQFLGADQLLATSQRGFFGVGREIPLERQFFVTPQETGLGIPITRISRLALVEPLRAPESIRIGFGIPPRPQIGIIRGEVARTQRRGAFELGRGEELEAFRTTGVVRDIAQIGRTRIRGQGVDIFEFQIGRGRGRARRPSEDFVSTEGTGRVSGESLLGTLGLRTTRAPSLRTSALVSPLLTGTISPPTTTPFIPPTTTPFSPGISPPLSPIISPPTTPTISPPTISPPRFPPISPPVRRPRDRKRKAPKKPKRKRARRTTPIRPSFTGIVLGIEEAAAFTPGIGVSPGEIRGLATGRATAMRRRSTRKKKKKS